MGHAICVHLEEVGKPNQFSWKGTEGGLKNWRSQTAWPTLALIGSKGGHMLPPEEVSSE